MDSHTTNSAIMVLQAVMVPETNIYPDCTEEVVFQWILVFIEHLLKVGPLEQNTSGVNWW
jgi:hypothetical protein